MLLMAVRTSSYMLSSPGEISSIIDCYATYLYASVLGQNPAPLEWNRVCEQLALIRLWTKHIRKESTVLLMMMMVVTVTISVICLTISWWERPGNGGMRCGNKTAT